MAQNYLNDPSLPSYRHPALVRLEPALELVRHVWDGLYQVKETYLPKAFSEPPLAYTDRLRRAVFNNKYRGQIESISGLLTAFEIEGLPPSFEQADDDGVGLDGQGSDWKGLLRQADEMALRDGCCYVLTNNTQLSVEDVERRTAADPGTYPQYTLIDRRNVLNWRCENQGGSLVITQITILIHQEVPEGEYGYTVKPYYYTFRVVPQGVELQVAEIVEQGGRKATVIVSQSVAPIERIPVHAYPDITAPFPTDADYQLPHLLKSAELNIKLFQQDSSLDTIQYRVNAPTVYRISSIPFTDRPPMIFGPNHVIELMRDTAVGTAGTDEVGVVEITGAGIEALQASVEATKREIDEEGAGFMGGGTVARSATEAHLSAVRASATLDGWARAKTQAIHALIEDWCMFTGEEPGAAVVSLDSSMLEQPLDSGEFAALTNAWEKGAIDHRTYLELLRMGRQLPRDIDIEKILAAVGEERAASMPMPIEMLNGLLTPLDAPSQNEPLEAEVSS